MNIINSERLEVVELVSDVNFDSFLKSLGNSGDYEHSVEIQSTINEEIIPAIRAFIENLISQETELNQNGFYQWIQKANHFFSDYDSKWMSKSASSPQQPLRRVDVNEPWKEWDAKKTRWLQQEKLQFAVELCELFIKKLPDNLSGRRTSANSDNLGELVRRYWVEIEKTVSNVVRHALEIYAKEFKINNLDEKLHILELKGESSVQPLKGDNLDTRYAFIHECCYLNATENFNLPTRSGQNDRKVAETLENKKQGTFDVVIADGIFHSEKDVRMVLRMAKRYLKKNGLFILSEKSCRSFFPYLVIGLTEKFTVTPASSVLNFSDDKWLSLLYGEGFDKASSMVTSDLLTPYQIIVARSNGVIRLERTSKPNNIDVDNNGTTSISNQEFIKPTDSLAHNDWSVRQKGRTFFKELIGSALKIPVEQLNVNELLEKYGVDSIIVVQLGNRLNEFFPDVNSSIFFEHPTIDKLVEYFLGFHRFVFLNLLGFQIDSNEFDVLEKAKVPVAEGKIEVAFSSSEKTAIRKMEIAIIGVAGRFPMARDMDSFYDKLKKGTDCITEVPAERWDWKQYFDNDMTIPGKSYCKWGGFIDGISDFDPLFFNVSPRDAVFMDPQIRLFFESVHTLLENSGYTKERLKDRHRNNVGVYVGAMYQQYRDLTITRQEHPAMSLSSYSSIANRISHFFNFCGPSVAIDTMCSSSLLAIHMACQSLRLGECSIAVAGGVNLSIHPNKFVGLSQARLIASKPDSRSFTNGDGYLPSEAIGCVLLKPLPNALADGDSILGIIRSSVTNHDGKSNGFAVPNPIAQEELIRRSFIESGIPPDTITYMEAAANGSPIGDVVEFTALKRAFAAFTKKEKFCAIGSVKSNIGHAEAASGISQVAKVLLQLKHGEIFPTIKTENLNPQLSFDNSPFYIQKTTGPWNRQVDGSAQTTTPRRAAISSFGAGGTNVHLIVEEFVKIEGPVNDEDERPRTVEKIFVFSANTKENLLRLAQRFIDFLKVEDIALGKLAYSLQTARDVMDFKLAVVAHDKNQLIERLSIYQSSKSNLNELSEESIFTAQPTEDHHLKNFFSGKLAHSLVDMLCVQGSSEELAFYWIQGGKVPWHDLHRASQKVRCELPNYPFVRQTYWVDANADSAIVSSRVLTEHLPPQSKVRDILILEILSEISGIPKSQIPLHKSLHEIGFNSSLAVLLVGRIQKDVTELFTIEDLSRCSSIGKLISVISAYVQQTSATARRSPCTVKLNSSNYGRPIFWIHPAFGGVQPYLEIASKAERPFYGIQAKGWMSDEKAIKGISNMANYYVTAIRSVDSVGPYDLGGFSIGGLLAYEVARILQSAGAKVNSLVMIDTIPPKLMAAYKLDRKSELLQSVNLALLMEFPNKANEFETFLINRNELPASQSENKLLEQLVEIAEQRGLSKTVTEIKKMISQMRKINQSYELEQYDWPSLTKPLNLKAIYFKNKSGFFLGQMEPYCNATASGISMDHLNQEQQWKSKLPELKVIEIESMSHMSMLSELKSSLAILDVCESLYSNSDLEPEELTRTGVHNESK